MSQQSKSGAPQIALFVVPEKTVKVTTQSAHYTPGLINHLLCFLNNVAPYEILGAPGGLKIKTSGTYLKPGTYNMIFEIVDI